MNNRVIFAMQVASLLLIWILVCGIITFIFNLLSLSIKLQDVPSVTIAISLVAIPVFITLASVLTYVFVGLQKNK
jgi:hypothetical protein